MQEVNLRNLTWYIKYEIHAFTFHSKHGLILQSTTAIE